MQSDYIEHMQKGGQKKVHKYLSRYYKNGKWFYRYKVTGEGYKEDAKRYKEEHDMYVGTAREAQDQANGKKERTIKSNDPQHVANTFAAGSSYYGRKAAESEAGYKKSLKGKAESAIAKGQAKIDKILKSETKITVTSNLTPAGQEKVIKEKVIKENTIPEKKIYEKKTYENGDTINIKELSEKNKKKKN